MESVIYLLAFVISMIVLFKSGLKEVAWALIFMPIMVIFLIIVVIWQIKRLVDKSQKTYLDVLKEKAHDAKKKSIESDAEAKISELEKKIVFGESIDDEDIEDVEENQPEVSHEVSSIKLSSNSGCVMAGQNKNAPGDHIGNKSCRENSLFTNDKCKSKCGVKTDVGMNICCDEVCCDKRGTVTNDSEKKKYFKKDTDLQDVYDQIRENSDELSQGQTEKYYNYDPNEPNELQYKNFI